MDMQPIIDFDVDHRALLFFRTGRSGQPSRTGKASLNNADLGFLTTRVMNVE
jgi:hypothetical protein